MATTTTEDTENTNSTGGSLGGKFKQRNMNRYKTELCRAFEEAGLCKYAEKCQVRSLRLCGGKSAHRRLLWGSSHPAADPVIGRASQCWCRRSRNVLSAALLQFRTCVRSSSAGGPKFSNVPLGSSILVVPQFAHGPEELRTLSRHPKYRTELCRSFHNSGVCP